MNTRYCDPEARERHHAKKFQPQETATTDCQHHADIALLSAALRGNLSKSARIAFGEMLAGLRSAAWRCLSPGQREWGQKVVGYMPTAALPATAPVDTTSTVLQNLPLKPPRRYNP